jgi:hypothetical protein
MNFLVACVLLALKVRIQTVGSVVHNQEGATDMADFHFVLLAKDWIDVVILLELLQIRLHLFDFICENLSLFNPTLLAGFFHLGKCVLDLLLQHDHLFLLFVLARIQ